MKVVLAVVAMLTLGGCAQEGAGRLPTAPVLPPPGVNQVFDIRLSRTQ